MFKKKDMRNPRELLRENLATIPVDMFYIDDPLTKLTEPERKLYLKYFSELVADGKLLERIVYLINKQAKITLEHAKDGIDSTAGGMTINGMAVIKDDIERLSGMHLKESLPPETFDKYKMF